MRSRFLRTGALAVMATALASLLLPGAAFAQEDLAEQLTAKAAELDMVWVAIACILVFFMQAGFMFLEIGFSRQKNAGTAVATTSSAPTASSSTSVRRSAAAPRRRSSRPATR